MQCTQCTGPLNNSDKFCPNCGAKVEVPKPPGISFGDVGMFKGNIDTSVHTHIGQQTNIEGGVHINLQASKPEPDAGGFFKRGIQQLQIRSFEEAIRMFTQALSLDPMSDRAHYYLVLASLKGKRPRLLTRSHTLQLEEHLRAACNFSAKAHYLYLWALLKYEVFFTQGFTVPPPGIVELVELAATLPPDWDSIREMLVLSDTSGGPIFELIQQRR